MNGKSLCVRLMLLGVAAAMLGGAGGCKNLKGENEALWKENKELHDELAASREALEAANRSLAEAQQALADAQSSANRGDKGGGFKELEGQGVGVRETVEGTEITMVGDLLFDSGQATIKSTFRSKLQQIARALNQDNSREIRVEGHTDSDPIRKSKWKDNYHLSEARAVAVRDYLSSQGVDRNRMTTVGHGPDNPVADNSSKANKARNRRVEIIVVR